MVVHQRRVKSLLERHEHPTTGAGIKVTGLGLRRSFRPFPYIP